MKIFNDFDSKWKENEYNDAVSKYWKENVMLIERSFAFWVMRWIFPSLLYTAIAVFLWYIAIVLLADYTIISWTLVWIIMLFLLLFLNYLVRTYLDYKFDFTLVTKWWVYTFKQIGFFNSKNKDLPANKIRSIESQRFWILWNIFWYWNIVIVTDGSMHEKDENGRHIWWKTKITYISNSKQVTKNIMELCLSDR